MVRLQDWVLNEDMIFRDVPKVKRWNRHGDGICYVFQGVSEHDCSRRQVMMQGVCLAGATIGKCGSQDGGVHPWCTKVAIWGAVGVKPNEANEVPLGARYGHGDC